MFVRWFAVSYGGASVRWSVRVVYVSIRVQNMIVSQLVSSERQHRLLAMVQDVWNVKTV